MIEFPAKTQDLLSKNSHRIEQIIQCKVAVGQEIVDSFLSSENVVYLRKDNSIDDIFEVFREYADNYLMEHYISDNIYSKQFETYNTVVDRKEEYFRIIFDAMIESFPKEF